jgi:predicted dehydrogenase
MEEGMENPKSNLFTRRAFAGAAAFTIVPRHVLGGPGYTPPSDKITLASIGLGRQGMVVTMQLLARPDIQVVAVADPNEMSKDYAEYGANALLKAERRLLGPGYENWGEELSAAGEKWLIPNWKSSMGAGGREPAKKVADAYYSSRKNNSYRGCTAYRDFRELLEKEKDLDAVYVATPDHWHAGVSISAMLKRKHVLSQKPMAHNIGEARRMADVAQEMKVVGALPVNNPTSRDSQAIHDWIADGAIGTLREVHNWSSRPNSPQGIERPKETPPVPKGFDWDLWVGPAPSRPYHPLYHPFQWRAWLDFGTGAIGNMGSYSFAGLFKILDLTAPTAVEASATGWFDSSAAARAESYPKASIIHLDFPAHNSRAAIRMTWYEGGLRPPRPEGLRPEDDHYFQPGEANEGVLYIGDKGYILAGFNGNNPRVYPESAKYQLAPRQRGSGTPAGERDNAIEQWVAAVKGGAAPATNYGLQVGPTESLLLGVLAQRFAGQRLEWDSANMRVTNVEKVNPYVNPPYRSEYKV